MTDKELWDKANKYSFTGATVFKLLKQIEKMKCCENCTKKYCHHNNYYFNDCIKNNKYKWELNCSEKPNN